MPCQQLVGRGEEFVFLAELMYKWHHFVHYIFSCSAYSWLAVNTLAIQRSRDALTSRRSSLKIYFKKTMPRCSNLQQIALPKCCQQRRSGRVKRRKQYAGFTWINFSCDRPWQGGMSHFSSCKDDQPGTTGRRMDLIKGTLISGHLMRGHDNFQIENSISTDREHETNILKRLQRPINELESLTQSTISDSTENGAWVDPLGDLSDFDEGFEEKNCNFRMDFKDVLKEALIKRSCLNHHQHWDSRYLNCIPSQLNPSSDEAAWKASSSSGEKGDETQQRRGKRKRKPKVHFDEEVPFSIRSLRRMRRLRIMRHLGLVAPPGSPFILNPPVRTTA